MSTAATVHKMGVMQLTLLTVVNMMGSGIILLPTKLAEVGTLSITSWIVTALGSLALAYAFAKCGRFNRKAGGMGGYAEYAFGTAGNFLANYTYGVSLLIANVAIALTAVGYMQAFFGWTLSPVAVSLASIAVLWLTTVPNFGGARITGQIGAVTVWGIILPVVGISLIGWFWFDPQIYLDAWNPRNMGTLDAVSASISITLWSFLGLESACANADAVENPERTVPIAVLVATIGVALIYIASTNVVAGIIPNAELIKSSAPFGLAFSRIMSPAAGQVVIALMIIACLGSLLGWQFTVAQVFKSSSDVGYFVRLFGKATAKGTPVVGMIILTLVQTGLAMMTMSTSLSEQFNLLVNLAVVTNLVPYILSMSALAVMMKAYGAGSREYSLSLSMAFVGNAYSFYALYSSGQEAMFWGALVTFFGWLLYGTVSHKFDLVRNQDQKAV
ncbi:putrescine-ornithine antiporter [Pseudomonas juntendi]|uniref:putrescine-ornithine antiporter n=1 Tax=Pseudomonas juntendi TaxID=2666183 RepID=UPI00345CF4E5